MATALDRGFLIRACARVVWPVALARPSRDRVGIALGVRRADCAGLPRWPSSCAVRKWPAPDQLPREVARRLCGGDRFDDEPRELLAAAAPGGDVVGAGCMPRSPGDIPCGGFGQSLDVHLGPGRRVGDAQELRGRRIGRRHRLGPSEVRPDGRDCVPVVDSPAVLESMGVLRRCLVRGAAPDSGRSVRRGGYCFCEPWRGRARGVLCAPGTTSRLAAPSARRCAARRGRSSPAPILDGSASSHRGRGIMACGVLRLCCTPPFS